VRDKPIYSFHRDTFFITLLLLTVSLICGCAQKGGRSLEPASVPSHPENQFNEPLDPVIALEMNGESEEVSVESEQIKALELEGLQSLGEWKAGEPAEEIAEAQVQYDFPVTMNRQVEYYLDFFQNKNRRSFARWLSRSTAYLPFIKKQLKEAGLPQDLAYLAMIESGFSQTARSRARAVGMWQFIRSTALNYGLKVNNYVDERRDPVKSTEAAVEYLTDLYEEFGSWYLAVAGYNAGEGKIRRAVKKYESTNFWVLAQGRYLKLETKRYVPKLIAAIIIAKNPEQYGFSDVAYQAPLVYDTIETPRWTALKAVALACDVDVKVLQGFNRELLKPFTPPDSPAYLLKLPVGKKEMVEKNLPRVHAIVSTNYKTYVVRNGESLSRVCRKYGLTKTIILKANNLRSATLEPGQRLRIPYRTTKYELLPEGTVAPAFLAADGNGDNFILHKVRPGQTVSEIALRYNVPTHLVAGWNDLKDISRIRAGQQLALYIRDNDDFRPATVRAETNIASIGSNRPLEKNSADGSVSTGGQSAAAAGREMMHYSIRRGDSLWTIARKFDITVEEIRNWNNLDNNLIHPGNSLLIGFESQPLREIEQDEKGVYYLVRGGDSLWTIARKFKQSTEKLRKWNNLKNDVIYPGNRLLVKLADLDV
jgi:membrane-bound lytic murein transglycosylase D